MECVTSFLPSDTSIFPFFKLACDPNANCRGNCDLERIQTVGQIENALRESLAKPRAMRETIRLITASGPGVKPGVDLDNGRSLLDIMDDPS